jgi:hypothetical protein
MSKSLRDFAPNPRALFIIHTLNQQYGAVPRYLGF